MRNGNEKLRKIRLSKVSSNCSTAFAADFLSRLLLSPVFVID